MTPSPEADGSRLNLIVFGLGLAGIAGSIATAVANRSSLSVASNQYYAAGTPCCFPFYTVVVKAFTILRLGADRHPRATR